MRSNSKTRVTLVAALAFLAAACSSSVEEVSKKPADIQPPKTTASHSSGVYQAISVELTCKSFPGRTCIVYFQKQVDDQDPTPSQPYINAISLVDNGVTKLIFWAEDEDYVEKKNIKTYTIDTIKPSASFSPDNNTYINPTDEIVITFSESMKQQSLVLSGTKATESNGGIWSTTTAENDTLTISPVSIWTDSVADGKPVLITQVSEFKISH